jgi:hypothetical protein
METIFIYTADILQQIYLLAEKGFDLAHIARQLGISYTQLWLDYKNPELEVGLAYDEGFQHGIEKNRERLEKSADKSYVAQDMLSKEQEAAHLRNKMMEIKTLRENMDI